MATDRSMLPPAEREAVKRELLLVKNEKGFSQVALGKWLGFKQQTISKALDGDLGPTVAQALYEKLGTTRADLIAKHRGMVPDDMPEEDGLESTGISPNRRRALAAFEWEGVEPREYETIHNQLAADYFATGIDPEPEYWLARIRTLLAEVRGKSKRVPDPAHDEAADDRDARELAEHKAAQALKRLPARVLGDQSAAEALERGQMSKATQRRLKK